jgi:hypothetical protein
MDNYNLFSLKWEELLSWCGVGCGSGTALACHYPDALKITYLRSYFRKVINITQNNTMINKPWSFTTNCRMAPIRKKVPSSRSQF